MTSENEKKNGGCTITMAVLVLVIAALLVAACQPNPQDYTPPDVGTNNCSRVAFGFPYDVYECSYRLDGFVLHCLAVGRESLAYEFGYPVWAECEKEDMR